MALESPLNLMGVDLPRDHKPSPAELRKLQRSEYRLLADTFTSNSSANARDHHIFQVYLKLWPYQRQIVKRISLKVDSVVVIGHWAHATWQDKVWFANISGLPRRSQIRKLSMVVNGSHGTAWLRRSHGHWRVATYVSSFIPGEGP